MKLNVERSDVRNWLTALAGAQGDAKRAKLWKRLYKLTARPTRRRVEVDLYKIDRNSSKDDNVIVPGKVLSTGALGHPISITAIAFSASALESLKSSKCEIIALPEMMKRNRLKIII
ncbi:MAG: 50S ribosomal protein L18e, partial [Candidatus Marsarchaeota archaeon]|nr:50S ribosomal protein L18e [Candidatus Marsarchaeota archaeon]